MPKDRTHRCGPKKPPMSEAIARRVSVAVPPIPVPAGFVEDVGEDGSLAKMLVPFDGRLSKAVFVVEHFSKGPQGGPEVLLSVGTGGYHTSEGLIPLVSSSITYPMVNSFMSYSLDIEVEEGDRVEIGIRKNGAEASGFWLTLVFIPFLTMANVKKLGE